PTCEARSVGLLSGSTSSFPTAGVFLDRGALAVFCGYAAAGGSELLLGSDGSRSRRRRLAITPSGTLPFFSHSARAVGAYRIPKGASTQAGPLIGMPSLRRFTSAALIAFNSEGEQAQKTAACFTVSMAGTTETTSAES